MPARRILEPVTRGSRTKLEIELAIKNVELTKRVAELEEMLNEAMPWCASPEIQDRISKTLNR